MVVKAGKIGGRAVELVVADNARIAQVKEAYGEDLTGLETRLNGEVVPDNTPVDEGDVISFLPAETVKGGR